MANQSEEDLEKDPFGMGFLDSLEDENYDEQELDEAQEILTMDCIQFNHYLKEEYGIEIDEETHDDLHLQMGQLDGTGVETSTIDAMETKLHSCYVYDD